MRAMRRLHSRLLPRLLTVALVPAAVLGGTRAHGYPDFHHAGSVCRGATSGDAGRIQYQDSSFAVLNESTSSAARVHCAIDFTETTLVPWAVSVAVQDAHPTQNITCRISMFSEGGTLRFQDTLTSDPSYGPDEAQQLFFFLPDMGTTNFYNLRCDLPPSGVNGPSKVLTYQLLQ